MKQAKDKKKTVKEHQIEMGAKVLLQRKKSKHDSVYNPQPYTVTGVY